MSRSKRFLLAVVLVVLLCVPAGAVLASNALPAIPAVTITPVLLAQIVAAILSLVFSYVPGASDWWGTLTGTQKQAAMAGMLVIVSLAIFGLSCGQVVEGITCDKPGITVLVSILIQALIANQAVFLISKPEKVV